MVQSAFRRGRKPLSAADTGSIYAFLRPKVPAQNGDDRVLQNSPDNSIVVNEMANGQLPLRNDCVATPPKRRKKKKEVESGQSSGKDDCVATPPKRRKKKKESTESGQSSDKDDFVSTPKKMRKKRDSPAKKEGQSPARRASKRVQKKLDEDCGTSRNLEVVIQAECYDLRKESRSVDEKYALLSAGKPVHPFFLRQKSSEQSNTQTETPIDPDSLLYPSPPFHVIQNIENIDVKVEWNGIFRKTSIEPRSSRDEEVHSSALISRDNISAFLVSSLDCLSARDPLQERFADMIDFLKMSSDEVSCVGTSLEQLKETHAWYRARGISEMEVSGSNSNPNSLWTDLYQPQSSQQVCGNKSSVNALNEWLSCWKMKADSDNRSEILPLENNRLINDNDRGWFQDDSDREVSLIDDDELENALLLTGPVGSGKTAAIYACAKEQGFHVIEINASDCRSGTIIKHKFGEASESQALIWQDKSYLSQIPKGKTTLILFEEVDTVFEEDRGFVSAIVQLAKTAKRPIVLTSNRGQLQLPQLKRIEIRFVKPTVEDLVIHACMVCNANGLSGDPWLMKRIVQACQQDLRKLTMLLQFWGQGIFQENNQDVKPGLANNGCLLNDSVQVLSPTKRTEYSSKWLSQASWLFDSDAQFCLLPELLPLSFPCSISETVADRISQAVREADRISSLAAEHSAEARAHQAETERMQKRKKRKTSDLVYQSTTSKVVLNFDLNKLPPQEDGGFLGTSPCKPQKLKRLKRCDKKHEESNDYVPEKLATCDVPQMFSAEDITSNEPRTQDAVQEEAVDLERIPPGQDVTQEKTVDLQSTQPGDGVDPVSRQWLELKNASLSCQCKSLHATALSFCDALENAADKLSSCDVISTSIKDTEIAAQLAQGTLHHVLELCDEIVRQSDAGTSYSVPWHQQNENRLQRHKMLEAIFYANPKTARLALTANTFSDYISYMSRIVKLDDRHNIEFSRPRQRRSRGFQEDYLTQRHIPEAGIVALRQLFNFESSSH